MEREFTKTQCTMMSLLNGFDRLALIEVNVIAVEEFALELLTS